MARKIVYRKILEAFFLDATSVIEYKMMSKERRLKVQRTKLEIRNWEERSSKRKVQNAELKLEIGKSSIKTWRPNF